MKTDFVPGKDLRARKKEWTHSWMQPFIRANLRVLVRQSCISIPKAKHRDRRRYHQMVSAAPLNHTLEISSRSIDRDWKIRTSPTTFLLALLQSALPLLQTLGYLSTIILHDLSHQTNVDTLLNAPPRSSVAWVVSLQPKRVVQLKSISLNCKFEAYQEIE